jgi:hypothetical protein
MNFRGKSMGDDFPLVFFVRISQYEDEGFSLSWIVFWVKFSL